MEQQLTTILHSNKDKNNKNKGSKRCVFKDKDNNREESNNRIRNINRKSENNKKKENYKE